MRVKYIQGIVRIPEGFDRVKSIVKSVGGITITSFSDKTVYSKGASGFIHS